MALRAQRQAYAAAVPSGQPAGKVYSNGSGLAKFSAK